ncbi:PilZ domain-containing protein [Leptospira langatensis]|uniref:PilZ domain-containing protein n=1 Tax=Leptospira langatensis TaxID=2484983 RepID=A0A5F1ZU19_9LEPT|nr:PilZ domain-containing protein [Leptospira langatensis]TGK03197.1 PilZ domain-containing protein [Leptospira langatensis]TGL41953.1 PilZ domain-containing protein [Leptospira langatensis]
MQRLEIGIEPSSQKEEPGLFADKRFYIRFRKDNRVRLFDKGQWSEGILLDISMMGASIHSNTEWEVGSSITFMSPMFSCEIEGDIIRRSSSDHGYRYAIVFHDLCDANTLEILNKIAYCS